jgi:NarL family two-component system response regulator YdfI
MPKKNGGGTVRVVVAATSTLRRSALESIIRENHEFALVGSVPGLIGITEKVRGVHADVVLIDLPHPDVQFASIAASLEKSGAAVLALVDGPNANWITRALRAGVRSLLAREASPTEIAAAIQSSSTGMILLDPEIARELTATAPADRSDSVPDIVEDLTPREVEVLRMMAEGLGNKEIASRLGISDHTVKFHISSILAKMGAASRTEAVTMGIRMGLILL